MTGANLDDSRASPAQKLAVSEAVLTSLKLLAKAHTNKNVNDHDIFNDSLAFG